MTENRVKCPFCEKDYASEENLKKHIEDKHGNTEDFHLIAKFNGIKRRESALLLVDFSREIEKLGVEIQRGFKETFDYSATVVFMLETGVISVFVDYKTMTMYIDAICIDPSVNLNALMDAAEKRFNPNSVEY